MGKQVVDENDGGSSQEDVGSEGYMPGDASYILAGAYLVITKSDLRHGPLIGEPRTRRLVSGHNSEVKSPDLRYSC